MHKQIQHKLKKKIILDNIKHGEILSIDEHRSLILITGVIRTELDKEKTFSSLQTLHAFAIQRKFEHIAINVEPVDALFLITLNSDS